MLETPVPHLETSAFRISKHIVFINFFKLVVGVTFIAVSHGCGAINLGGSSLSNDLRPTTGMILSQGNFTSQNGQTVSGSAMVFSTNSSTSYILRLEGITAPTGTLQIQLIGTGTPPPTNGRIQTFTLRNNTGNQNYSFSSAVTNVTFTNVNLFSPTANLNYGAALLY